MKVTIAALLCASALGVAAPVLAQPYGPPPGAPVGPAMAGHDIRGQLETLERRIQDGDRDRTLDRGEFDRAMRELNSIRDQDRDMRYRNHGDLNDYDRGVLQQRIDNLSRSIHWMRTNGGPGLPPPGAMPPPPPSGPGQWSLDQREDWIQQRIERGRADGSLSRREAFRAQQSLNSIRAMQARLTRRDGGRLNGPDRLYIEQRLDSLRNSIHWMRDNGEFAPWARP